MKENIVKEYRLGDSTVWLFGVKELSETDLDEMYACCSRPRQDAADRIKSELKRRESVGAGYLLFLLKKRFSIAEDLVVLQSGKPVFQGDNGLHFNISHSGGYVALAFGKTPLGVDIECVKRKDLKVAKRFFRQEEYDDLAGKTGAEQPDIFCRMWTGKEAVLKASGAGLSVPLDSFSVLEEIVECSGKQYELHRQKITETGQELWVCVAKEIFCTDD